MGATDFQNQGAPRYPGQELPPRRLCRRVLRVFVLIASLRWGGVIPAKQLLQDSTPLTGIAPSPSGLLGFLGSWLPPCSPAVLPEGAFSEKSRGRFSLCPR